MLLKPKLLRDKDLHLEGVIIYGVVAYETIALSVNFFAKRRVIPPITDLIGPLTHSKNGKIVSWLILGFWWDHFYRNGEREFYEKLREQG